jgi:hypothetical protein
MGNQLVNFISFERNNEQDLFASLSEFAETCAAGKSDEGLEILDDLLFVEGGGGEGLSPNNDEREDSRYANNDGNSLMASLGLAPPPHGRATTGLRPSFNAPDKADYRAAGNDRCTGTSNHGFLSPESHCGSHSQGVMGYHAHEPGGSVKETRAMPRKSLSEALGLTFQNQKSAQLEFTMQHPGIPEKHHAGTSESAASGHSSRRSIPRVNPIVAEDREDSSDSMESDDGAPPTGGMPEHGSGPKIRGPHMVGSGKQFQKKKGGPTHAKKGSSNTLGLKQEKIVVNSSIKSPADANHVSFSREADKPGASDSDKGDGAKPSVSRRRKSWPCDPEKVSTSRRRRHYSWPGAYDDSVFEDIQSQFENQVDDGDCLPGSVREDGLVPTIRISCSSDIRITSSCQSRREEGDATPPEGSHDLFDPKSSVISNHSGLSARCGTASSVDIGSRSRRQSAAADASAARTPPALKRRQGISAKTGFQAPLFIEDVEEDKATYLSTPSNRLIIHPSNGPRMLWDCASLVIILMEAVVLPMGICFNAYPPDGIMWISTSFFLPDIILNFFTGFYLNGLLVMRQTSITQRYCFGWFPVDFLSTVPWEVFLPKDQGQASFMLKFAKIGKLMRVLRLLRILKLKALLQRVEDMFSSYIILFLLSIMKTILSYIFFCHWTACLWGWMGQYNGEDPPYVKSTCEPDGPCENGIGVNDAPWRRRYGFETFDSASQYLIALQFATGLMTGAELQMMPGWWLERVFVIVMMIVSFLICSIIISQIVVVMEKINQDNSEFLEHTRVIRDFMVSRGMPMRLQTKVKRYLEYQYKNRKVVHQNHEVMMKLSPFLRIEITEHMNKAILEHHPFFAGMEASVLSQVCCLARSVLYAPGDVIMRKGQLTSLIAFIVRGQLIIKDCREGVSIYVKPPAWVGDRGLFVTTVLPHTLTCSAHTEVLTIQQQDLIALMKEIPEAEAYIKDYCQKVLNNDATVQFCPYCRMAGHDLEECDELDSLAERAKIAKGRQSVRGDERGDLPAPVSTITAHARHTKRASKEQSDNVLGKFRKASTKSWIDKFSPI